MFKIEVGIFYVFIFRELKKIWHIRNFFSSKVIHEIFF